MVVAGGRSPFLVRMCCFLLFRLRCTLTRCVCVTSGGALTHRQSLSDVAALSSNHLVVTFPHSPNAASSAQSPPSAPTSLGLPSWQGSPPASWVCRPALVQTFRGLCHLVSSDHSSPLRPAQTAAWTRDPFPSLHSRSPLPELPFTVLFPAV